MNDYLFDKDLDEAALGESTDNGMELGGDVGGTSEPSPSDVVKEYYLGCKYVEVKLRNKV